MTDVTTTPVRLRGDGIDPGDLARIAAETGLAPLDTEGDPPSVDIVPEGEIGGLGTVLRHGGVAVVEHLDGTLFPAAALAAAIRDGAFFVSLSSRAAWSLDTAAAVTEGLIARDLMPDYLRHDVELSLHEAVINAVLHGNLALGGSLVDDPASFSAFCDRLTGALAEAERGCRRVEVTAWARDGVLHLRITDEGAGYDPAAVQPATLESKSGRGLVIMRQLSTGMEVTDGGRTVTLGFAV